MGLKELHILKLDNNFIMELTTCVKQWSLLLDLHLCHNQICRIDPLIGKLVSLQRIKASANKIEMLPEDIGLLKNLEMLDLEKNNLKVLPVEIGGLSCIQNINLNENCLTEIPHEFCLLKSLRVLDISDNNLSNLPESIGGLQSLEEIRASRNNIVLLPESIARLRQLKILVMSHNKLTEISKSLCKGLSKLECFDLSSNFISLLPIEISLLVHLRKLYLNRNKLLALPIEFANLLDNVNHIDVTCNPFDMLPRKWNTRWTCIEQKQSPSGYSNEEIFSWIRAQQVIYYAACDEWKSTNKLHLSRELEFSDFVFGDKKIGRTTGVLVRIKKGTVESWNEEKWNKCGMSMLRQFYFHCKSYGIEPRYEKLSDEETKNRTNVAQDAFIRRNRLANEVKMYDYANRADQKEKYMGDFKNKLNRAETHLIKCAAMRKLEKQKEIQLLVDEVDCMHPIQEQRETDLTRQRTEENTKEFQALKESINEMEMTSSASRRTLPIEIHKCW